MYVFSVRNTAVVSVVFGRIANGRLQFDLCFHTIQRRLPGCC